MRAEIWGLYFSTLCSINNFSLSGPKTDDGLHISAPNGDDLDLYYLSFYIAIDWTYPKINYYTISNLKVKNRSTFIKVIECRFLNILYIPSYGFKPLKLFR